MGWASMEPIVVEPTDAAYWPDVDCQLTMSWTTCSSKEGTSYRSTGRADRHGDGADTATSCCLRRPGGRVVLRLPDASVADRLSARQVCAVRREAGSRQRCCTPAQSGPTGHDHGDGLEWEHLMPEISRASDPSNIIWQLIDGETGAVNGSIRLAVHGWELDQNPAGQRGGLRSSNAPPVLLSAQTMAAGVSNSVSDTYASVCANSHTCISSLSLPSSSAIGRQITDVVTSGGQSSTKFVLRTIGACSRRGRFAVPVTLTVS